MRDPAYAHRRKWKRQFDLQRGMCALCGHPMPEDDITRDHIVPRSKGGSPDWENLQLCHRTCNMRKADTRYLTLAGSAGAWFTIIPADQMPETVETGILPSSNNMLSVSGERKETDAKH